jgi:elongation factor P
MPILAGDFKNGLTLLIDGNIYQVLDFQHVKPGKGAALLKTRLKNLRTGGILEKSFGTTVKFDQAIIEKKTLQYSYSDEDNFYFMDMQTFEMFQISKDIVGFSKNFLVEGMEVSVKFFESEILGMELPEKMTLEVTETTDAVAGNTSTTATKDAIVQTGFLVKVPLFVKLGDKIIVNTVDGKYCGRDN